MLSTTAHKRKHHKLMFFENTIPSFKSKKNTSTYTIHSINSEFFFMQLLVHQKGASLCRDLSWPQRRLVVTIRVNVMTSLSNCHICFVQCRGVECFWLFSSPLDNITASPFPFPSQNTNPSDLLSPRVPPFSAEHPHLTKC